MRCALNPVAFRSCCLFHAIALLDHILHRIPPVKPIPCWLPQQVRMHILHIHHTPIPAPCVSESSSIIGNAEIETEIAPILTDGLRLRSIHWTGHYIPDPTLAFTTCSHFPIRCPGGAPDSLGYRFTTLHARSLSITRHLQGLERESPTSKHHKNVGTVSR